jgi:hypothetical protein
MHEGARDGFRDAARRRMHEGCGARRAPPTRERAKHARKNQYKKSARIVVVSCFILSIKASLTWLPSSTSITR